MWRKLLAELVGSALLAGVVIGSGILGARLANGDVAVALLANTAATGAILYVLVTVLGPVCGAHFNPAVSLAMLMRREISLAMTLAYVPVQVAGCIAGAVLAHAMFALPLWQTATTVREGLWLSEGVATFALVFAIFGAARAKPEAVPAVVALVICAGYWWTPSTSFANPAITVARTLTDTFAGVRLADAPAFIAAQVSGAVLATGAARLIFGRYES
jgi:glycerol uptake facilitator-like aquaporin